LPTYNDLTLLELGIDSDASCYVLDFHVNLPAAEALAAMYAPFYRHLRDHKPDTPILLISPIRFSSEWYDQQKINKYEGMRKLIRTVYEDALSAGDTCLYYVHGPDLLEFRYGRRLCRRSSSQ
jgi:hypothetical protein